MNLETQKHKTDWNPPITNHKSWPFEPVKVKFCFLRGPLRWLTAGKNAIISWLFNFTICMFVKSTVIKKCKAIFTLYQTGFAPARTPCWVQLCSHMRKVILARNGANARVPHKSLKWRDKYRIGVNNIAGLHMMSQRPCWWLRTKAFLSSGN